jgi:hypothetical protein
MERCPRHDASHHPDAQRRPTRSGGLTTWTLRPLSRKYPHLPCRVCPAFYFILLYYKPSNAPRAVASPREHTNSHTSSLAPSSYHNKRAHPSSPTPSNAHNTGTLSSRTSVRLSRAPSSTRSGPHRSGTGPGAGPESASERERRRSILQPSIPISLLVTLHAPYIGRASSPYHMRDLRLPPRRMETGWALRFRTSEEEGSSFHAWMFYRRCALSALVDRGFLACAEDAGHRRDGHGEGGATGWPTD